MKKTITVQTTVNAPVEKVWECWSEPRHISNWAAGGDWEAIAKSNDLRVGGCFNTRMQAKDGSEGFDFTGTYTIVQKHKLIEYDMDDSRHVKVVFEETPDGVEITESFEAEEENSEDVQRAGWQAILNSFKKYVESIE